MPISHQDKKQYRAIGHNLKPVVTIAAKGLSNSVITEIKRALDDHELIKIKLAIVEREQRKSTICQICMTSGAELIQEIGKVALLFRASENPNPRTSNIPNQNKAL